MAQHLTSIVHTSFQLRGGGPRNPTFTMRENEEAPHHNVYGYPHDCAKLRFPGGVRKCFAWLTTFFVRPQRTEEPHDQRQLPPEPTPSDPKHRCETFQTGFIISPRGAGDIIMDFGGRQQPDRGVSGTTTTTTPSKRQRDFQEQLTQEKPPQTRRMMGMGLGDLVVEGRSSSTSSCSRSGSGSSSSAPSDGLFSTGEIDLLFRGCAPAAESKSSLTLSPLKSPALNAISPSTSGDSAMPPQGMSTPPAVASTGGSEEAAGGSSAPGGSFIFQSVSGGSSCVPPTKSKSTSSAAGEEEAVEGGGGAVGSNVEPPPNPWVYTVEGEVLDDNELGHRMSYLQMRGYDRAILDLMDESLQGIYEESDFGGPGYHEEDHESHSDKVETESAIVVEVVSYGPCDLPRFAQPAVVTPERA